MLRHESRPGRDKLPKLSRMRDRLRRADPKRQLYAISRRVNQLRIKLKIVPNRTGPRQSLVQRRRLAPPRRKSGSLRRRRVRKPRRKRARLLRSRDWLNNRRHGRLQLRGLSLRRKDPHRNKLDPSLLRAPRQPQGQRQKLVRRRRRQDLPRLQSLRPPRARSQRKRKSATDRRLVPQLKGTSHQSPS